MACLNVGIFFLQEMSFNFQSDLQLKNGKMDLLGVFLTSCITVCYFQNRRQIMQHRQAQLAKNGAKTELRAAQY